MFTNCKVLRLGLIATLLGFGTACEKHAADPTDQLAKFEQERQKRKEWLADLLSDSRAQREVFAGKHLELDPFFQMYHLTCRAEQEAAALLLDSGPYRLERVKWAEVLVDVMIKRLGKKAFPSRKYQAYPPCAVSNLRTLDATSQASIRQSIRLLKVENPALLK